MNRKEETEKINKAKNQRREEMEKIKSVKIGYLKIIILKNKTLGRRSK